MPVFSGEKLKVHLKLAIGRLKLLQQKKTNKAKNQRKEIAALLEAGKEESARIKVEHVIREDYTIEAYEILELFCDLLLARFGLLTTTTGCDDGIREAVETIIWAAPRAEVKELDTVREQLMLKYGREFSQAAMEADKSASKVNGRVLHKLSILSPQKELVTQYLVEIARANNIEFDPDVTPVVDIYGSGPAPPAGGSLAPDIQEFLMGNPNLPGGGSAGGGNIFDAPIPALPPPVPAGFSTMPVIPAPAAPMMPIGMTAEQMQQYQMFIQWQQMQAGGAGGFGAPGFGAGGFPGGFPGGAPPPPSGGFGGAGGFGSGFGGSGGFGGGSGGIAAGGMIGGGFASPPPTYAPAPAAAISFPSVPGGDSGSRPPSFGGIGEHHAPGYSLMVHHPPPAAAPKLDENEFGLPSIPTEKPRARAPAPAPAPPPAAAPSPPPTGGDSVPDFDDLAARFAALKRKK